MKQNKKTASCYFDMITGLNEKIDSSIYRGNPVHPVRKEGLEGHSPCG